MAQQRREYNKIYMRIRRSQRPDVVEQDRRRAREYQRVVRASGPEGRLKLNGRCKEWRIRLKRVIFAAYGGDRCACCGETEKAFLELDHINGDGYKHRKQLNHGKNVGSNCYLLYRDLEKKGFPPGYQILCANCNVGKYRNGGICPHKVLHA